MPHIVVARALTGLREASYLTDAGLAVTHGIEFVEATLTLSDEYDGDRSDVKHGYGGSLPPTQHAGRTVAVRTVHELKGKGSGTYTDPLTEWPLYHVCLGARLSGVVAGGHINLTPVRPDLAGSWTGGWYTHDTFWKVLGIRGSMEFRMDAKRRGFAEFNGQGVLAPSYPVQQSFPAVTYPNQSVRPPVFINGGVALGSFTPVLTRFQVGLQNALAARNDANLVGGHAGFLMTGGQASWSFPGETVSLDTFNPYSQSLSGTTATLSGTLGSAAGNKFQFSAPAASLLAPNETDESGRILYDLQGGLHIVSGNDELTVQVVG